jgi:surface polysaccharide O-acyltransferase-like enzyme
VSTSTHTPSTAAPRGRIIAYDALRVFAIVSVVAIHTLMPYRATLPAHAAVRVFDDLLHYAVPLFVFMSGALMWTRPWQGGPGAYREFLTRRFSAIALPYLAWAALYSAVFVMRAGDPSAALRQLPGLVLTGHVWYHLYFVPMLLTFYLLTPLASRIALRSPELLVLVAYGTRLLAGPAIVGLMRAAFGQLGWQYATHVVIHLPHMALGAWFALRLAAMPGGLRRAWPLLVAVGLAINAALSLDALSGMMPLARNTVIAAGMAMLVAGIVLKAIALEPRYERWAHDLTRAGSLAFGVYFVHPLLLLGVDGLVATMDAETIWLTQPWFPVAVWLGVCAGSFAIAGLFARFSATAWLVGLRRPTRR